MGSLVTSIKTTEKNETFTKLNQITEQDDFISKLIKNHKIVIFSTTSCYYCKLAKKELDKLNLSYHAIELDVDSNCPNEDCTSLTRNLTMMTRMMTVPQIFISGKLIGGFTDLDKLIKEKKI